MLKKIASIKIILLIIALLLPRYPLAYTDIPAQPFNQSLYQQLPENIRHSGEILSINVGSVSPYMIYSDPAVFDGASYDLAIALGQLLGVNIRHQRVNGLFILLTEIKLAKYPLAIGPIGDFHTRQADGDFIDYIQEYVIFVVRAGNRKNIHSLDDVCGKRIGVLAAGLAEEVLKQRSKQCISENKRKITIESFLQQQIGVAAVKSRQIDAYFASQAPLTYFVAQSNGTLELAGVGQANGFPTLYQGMIVPKNSPLAPILLAALQELFDNGTYALIMQKWGLENNMLTAPGINLTGGG